MTKFDFNRYKKWSLKESTEGASQYIRDKILEEDNPLAIPRWTDRLRVNYYFNNKKTNYTCVVFKGFKLSESIIYAYLYCLPSNKVLEINKTPDRLYDKIGFIRYCASPSLISQDGEFRTRMFPFDQINLLYKLFKNEMEFIENIVLKKIEAVGLDLSFDVFHPTHSQKKYMDGLDSLIVYHRLVVKFFVSFYISSLYDFLLDLQENHTNDNVHRLVFSNLDDDREYFNKIIKEIPKNILNDIIALCRYPYQTSLRINKKIISPNLHNYHFQYGQKLTPLSEIEVQNPFNLRYDIWKELYITKYLANMIFNNICYNVPFVLNWFYLKNENANMFDNVHQYEKIQYSEKSRRIISTLKSAQNLGLKTPSKFISPEFQVMSNKINPVINYIKKNILMGEVTMGFIVEIVGRTFYDIPKIVKTKLLESQLGNFIKDPAVSEMYIWDICYTLYCMQDRYDIIHNDLHLNNMTLHPMELYRYNKPNIKAQYDINNDENWDKKKVIAYRIKDIYFKRRFWYRHAFIIDFSRSLFKIKDHIKKHMKDNNYDENEIYQLSEQQKTNMVTQLTNTFPTFWGGYVVELGQYADTNFDVFFKIYGMIDFYSFSSKLLRYLQSHKLNQESKKILSQIKSISEHYLTNILKKMMKDDILNLENPILDLLQQVFQHNIISPQNTDKIMYYWDSTREIDKYTMHDKINLPKYMTDVCEEPHNTKLGCVTTFFPKTVNNKLHKDDKEMVYYIADRHKQKYH